MIMTAIIIAIVITIIKITVVVIIIIIIIMTLIIRSGWYVHKVWYIMIESRRYSKRRHSKHSEL